MTTLRSFRATYCGYKEIIRPISHMWIVRAIYFCGMVTRMAGILQYVIHERHPPTYVPSLICLLFKNMCV